MPTTEDSPPAAGTARERLRELHTRLPAGTEPPAEDLARVLELTEQALVDDETAAAAGEDAAYRRSTRVVVVAAVASAAVVVPVLVALLVVGGVGPAAVVAGAGALLLASGTVLLHLRSGAGGHRRRAVFAPVVAATGTAGVLAAALGAPGPVWSVLPAVAMIALLLLAGTVTARGGAR